MQYPEHEKLDKVKDTSQAIGEFLDWLQNERKVILCTIGKPYFDSDFEGYVPIHKTVEALLAEYFSIDLLRLSEEKAKMLEAIRAKGAY